MIGDNVSSVNVVYDDRAYGQTIDPTQWNANFKEIENKVNANVVAENELINGLAATADGASGADFIGITPLKEGGVNKLQGALEQLKADVDTAHSIHTARTDNPHATTKAHVGLGNADNTADIAKNVLSATKLTTARQIGSATFDGTGNITLAQIGGYTKTEMQTPGQSVVDWANLANVPNLADGSWKASVATTANLPVVGNALGDQRVVLNDGDGKQAIYACIAQTGTVDQQWDKVGDVDWMTEEQTRITQESARVSAETTRGTNEVTRVNNESTRVANEITRVANELTRQGHYIDMDNPHEVTKLQIGLGNVDNTSDADKPVSTAQATAIGLRLLASAPQLAGEMDINQHTVGGAETDNGNSGTAKTIDWRNGNHQKVLMTDNCTFTFTNPTRPCMLSLKLTQDGSGGRTITLPSIKWVGASVPSFSTAIDSIDILSLYFDGSVYYGQAGINFA